MSQIDFSRPNTDGMTAEARTDATTGAKTLKITRITHSCTLINVGGSVLLADPWFSEKFGYHRGEALGMRPADLPQLSGVLVSHAHYDHDDVKAISGSIDENVPFLVEAGAEKSARKAGFTNVTALAPWQSGRVGAFKVTATPAKHAVAEVGFVVEAEGYTVYFAGDTLAIPELSEIPRRFPHIDVALLPINGLSVFGKQVAMNPLEAAQLCATLHVATAIPTHYAFNGGITDLVMLKYYAKQDELPDLFRDALKRYAPATRPAVLQPGGTFTLDPSERKALSGRS